MTLTIANDIIERLKDKTTDVENITHLTSHILGQTNGLFLPDSDVDNKSNLILEAFQYIQSRPANAHKIRAYDFEAKAGAAQQQTKYTVIEILNDDMPFLVDSIMGEIQDRQINILSFTHPIFRVARDGAGQLQSILSEGAGSAPSVNGQETHTVNGFKESFIQILTEALTDEEKRALVKSLSNILDAVRLAVADWQPMRAKVADAISNYNALPSSDHVTNLPETIEFLKWLLDDHFTFLGIRQYRLIGQGDESDLEPIENSGLGLLRDKDIRVLRRQDQDVRLPEEIREFFFSPQPLIITKANRRSIVHRRVHMDYIGIKVYSQDGEICGELRIVGLFTSVAYTQLASEIPFLRGKVDAVVKRYGQSAKSHGAKSLINVLNTYPRDDLFQIDVDRLYDIAMGIHELDIQPKLRVFTRRDAFHRFVSVLIFAPRDEYSTEARMKMGDYLAKTLHGHVAVFTPFFTEGPLVRIHFVIGRDEGEIPVYADEQLETEITAILRSWSDKLHEELLGHFAFDEAVDAANRYRNAFPVGYQALVSETRAVEDITRIDTLNVDNPIAIDFCQDCEGEDAHCRVSIYHLHGPIPLSKRVPILENFGFSVIDERSFSINVDKLAGVSADDVEEAEQDFAVNLHDMVLVTKDRESFSLREHAERLEQAFLAVWYDSAENDPFNQLILKLGVDWRDVAALRALSTYMRQLGIPFPRSYISATLAKHPEIANTILDIFRLQHDPERQLTIEDREDQAAVLKVKIEEALSHIPSLDEDRILRYFVNIISAIWRTNFYIGKTAGPEARPETISFKLNSSAIDIMPEPKPFAEIFVYAPRVEGIHLRGGKIARGGLRWSDRQQDFRTEVLGLAKAQQVKNTVIVPTGAKGGFVPKKLPQGGAREHILEEGIACYQLFISSLLSLTDNIDGEATLKPKDVVCHDGDDPYLVVAADKGTAAFSDYANEISQRYNFWMDDAFASGGSAGYDHKKMAITARGAWESVKRHFREMDRNIQAEAFSVIGVGDMSGDVFGNGMLLSKSIKLIAAFDHRDIFIDPHPDPETSWNERQRLFDMGRSSWQDYDQSFISSGGGIFSRQAKSIALSDEIRALTGLDAAEVTPAELINALLKSQADLLWFGGIGTYVRGDRERNEDVGDRANDHIRITSSELKAKVVGEGANLGMTQAARIAYALKGGRVNTDAIDNSAGVNSSDLEVNIKIALAAAMKASLITREARNDLLVEMKEDVAASCLRNNYLQSLTISLGQRRGIADMSYQQRLMRKLEAQDLLDRALEGLPNDAELAERYSQGVPLTRPELSVLLAYAKLDLFDKLVECHLPDDPFLEGELISYFPKLLYERFPNYIKNHPLRREIIATQLTNAIINRGGSTMTIRLKEETGYAVESISYAFIATRAIFDVEAIFTEIDALDTKISGAIQLELYAMVQTLLRQQTVWMLRNVDLSSSLSNIISLYQNGLHEFESVSEAILDADLRTKLEKKQMDFEINDVPPELAHRVVGLKRLFDGPDVILISKTTNSSIAAVASIYGQVGKYFDIFALKDKAVELHAADHFDRIAINNALEDIGLTQRLITQSVLHNHADDAACFNNWLTEKGDLIARVKQNLHEILDVGDLSLAKLTVSVSLLRTLCSENSSG